MERKLEEIATEALQLPDEYERVWVEEAARRYQQLKAGAARSIASEEVFARLEARPRR
jgi:hypothetical protein